MLIDDSRINRLTGGIIGAAIEVHRALGPGLLESTYAVCVQHELTRRDLPFVVERRVPIAYKGVSLDSSYRIDLIVDEIVLVEIKAVEALHPIHHSQVLTYLRLTGCPAALLINFNVPKLLDGVKRFVNTR